MTEVYKCTPAKGVLKEDKSTLSKSLDSLIKIIVHNLLPKSAILSLRLKLTIQDDQYMKIRILLENPQKDMQTPHSKSWTEITTGTLLRCYAIKFMSVCVMLLLNVYDSDQIQNSTYTQSSSIFCSITDWMEDSCSLPINTLHFSVKHI